MTRLVNPRTQFFNNSGDPLVNGKLFFFESGTSTPKSTFADISETIANTDPVILTASGRVQNIFFTGTARVKLTDKNDVQIWDVDPVGGELSSGAFGSYDNETIYGAGGNNIVTGSDGNYYLSLTAANQSNNPTTSPANWLQIEFTKTWNTNETFALNEYSKASDGFLYRSKIASNTGNDPVSSPTEWGSPIPPIASVKGADLVSASPLVIGTDGDFFDVTGTTGFSAMTVAADRAFVLQFDAAVPITVGAGITLNNKGSNFTTSAGDIIECQSTATDTVTGWIIKSDGTPVNPKLEAPLDTNSFAINESQGAAVASATTTDIFGGDDGNTLHITGTTTIVDFTDASSAGLWRKITFDDILTLTHGSGITLPGSANITTAAGDYAFVNADTVSAFKVVYFKADGTPVVAPSGGFTLGTEQSTGSGTSVTFPISSGATVVFVNFEGVSLSGTDSLFVQLGDSGGVEITGYEAGQTIITTAISSNNSTVAFPLKSNGAGSTIQGSLILSLKDSANNTWIATGVVYSNSEGWNLLGGSKSLSGELTDVTISPQGADTYDGGSINTSII